MARGARLASLASERWQGAGWLPGKKHDKHHEDNRRYATPDMINDHEAPRNSKGVLNRVVLVWPTGKILEQDQGSSR
jgi:hypothetical protein